MASACGPDPVFLPLIQPEQLGQRMRLDSFKLEDSAPGVDLTRLQRLENAMSESDLGDLLYRPSGGACLDGGLLQGWAGAGRLMRSAGPLEKRVDHVHNRKLVELKAYHRLRPRQVATTRNKRKMTVLEQAKSYLTQEKAEVLLLVSFGFSDRWDSSADIERVVATLVEHPDHGAGLLLAMDGDQTLRDLDAVLSPDHKGASRRWKERLDRLNRWAHSWKESTRCARKGRRDKVIKGRERRRIAKVRRWKFKSVVTVDPFGTNGWTEWLEERVIPRTKAAKKALRGLCANDQACRWSHHGARWQVVHDVKGNSRHLSRWTRLPAEALEASGRSSGDTLVSRFELHPNLPERKLEAAFWEVVSGWSRTRSG